MSIASDTSTARKAQLLRLAPAITAELELAAGILRRLPLPSYAKPAPPPSSWPDLVRESWRAMALRPSLEHARRNRPARPAPIEIDAMERVLQWLWWLDQQQRRVVWARALKISWRKLAASLACTVAQARHRHLNAVRVLARQLDAQGWQVRALTALGEAREDWSEQQWELARRAGISWVLQPPGAGQQSLAGMGEAGSQFSASQVSQAAPYGIS